jgi:hypothetical protein
MEKQTAMQKHIEWLKIRISISKQLEESLLNDEKKQIIEAYEQAIETDVYTQPLKTGEIYYNETF